MHTKSEAKRERVTNIVTRSMLFATL